MHAIDEIASKIAVHPLGDLPFRTRETCSLLVADLMAATAGGVGTPLAQAAQAAVTGIYGAGSAGIWLTGKTASIAGAAMANSAAASALDIDDGHRSAAGHPGAGIIPAALAVGQALGASDEQIFDAIVLGYDVGLRIAASRPMPTIDTYCSGRWINYGVAVTAGRLLQLDAKAQAHAIAIAGAEGPISVSAGVSKYQGSSVKEVIPPAVIAGLTGAFRAEAGATGPLDLLDREERYSRTVLTGGFGEHWWIEDCYLKPYACCRWIHAAIDAILALRRPGAPIRTLRIETFSQGLRLANERAPQTLEGAQYSYYFTCALAALRGIAALQPIKPRDLGDAEVRELAQTIELVAHDDFSDAFPGRTPCRVIMDQGEGPQSLTVTFPLGDVANPMDRSQIISKFRRLSEATISRESRDRVLTALDDLTHGGFQPLVAALAA